MTDQATIFRLLSDQMADPETRWSLGTFGAIAEFMRDADEPVGVLRTDDALAAVTDRGAIRIAPLADMRPVASESAIGEGWSHRVALCLDEDRCAMNRRNVLTELGPDSGALRAEDQDGILFDLGLGCLQLDACIRISDPELIRRMRAHAGQTLFGPGNGAMAAILATSPHRVFISRLGRIEVFQPIPGAGGKSPMGPHTHVLPKLLAHGRTHAATEPIPTGLVPCAHLYPPHPAKDGAGRPQPFDARRHDAFQRMLDLFGDAGFVALKRAVEAAVEAGEGTSAVSIANNRIARASLRVVLRQLKARGKPPPTLAAWMMAHNDVGLTDPDPEDSEVAGGH